MPKSREFVALDSVESVASARCGNTKIVVVFQRHKSGFRCSFSNFFAFPMYCALYCDSLLILSCLQWSCELSNHLYADGRDIAKEEKGLVNSMLYQPLEKEGKEYRGSHFMTPYPIASKGMGVGAKII